jgi:hypothetical protein
VEALPAAPRLAIFMKVNMKSTRTVIGMCYLKSGQVNDYAAPQK